MKIVSKGSKTWTRISSLTFINKTVKGDSSLIVLLSELFQRKVNNYYYYKGTCSENRRKNNLKKIVK